MKAAPLSSIFYSNITGILLDRTVVIKNRGHNDVHNLRETGSQNIHDVNKITLKVSKWTAACREQGEG